MPTTLVSVYDRLPAADQARNELLASGFDSDSVHFSAQQDEAGAMKGNFTVGNPDRNINEPRDKFGPDKGRQTYGSGYANPQQHAEILLTVDPKSDQQTQQASDILYRCGAVRVERR